MDKYVDSEVKRACIEFCRWLRKEYKFPIRVPVYIRAKEKIKSMDGQMVSATFFGPFDSFVEPYIRVSAGDYFTLLKNRGRDDALCAILHSIAHELTHYFQWVNALEQPHRSEEWQATFYAGKVIDDYASIREHP